ncbi:hypothetical protein ABW21_db0206086 [Orbilia brochopaga]|nr:hypothetical protein ABW21_db0206086 [Drechslerella brochopaga]
MADDDLAKRFENIFSKRPVANDGWDKQPTVEHTHGGNVGGQATDEPSLEDLLDELGAEDTSWIEEANALSQEGKQLGTLKKDDSDAVSRLLAEARRQMQQDQHNKSDAPDDSRAVMTEKEEESANSDDEAEELLRQIQDSIGLDDEDEQVENNVQEKKPIAAAQETNLNALARVKSEDDEDEELRKRFEALEKLSLPPAPSGVPTGSLGLPLAPTSKPTAKGKKTIKQQVDDLADDIEHWCCMCSNLR